MDLGDCTMSDNRLTDLFKKNKKPLPKTIRNYEGEQENNGIEQILRFPVLMAVSVVLVAAVIITVIFINKGNNVFSQFVKASSKSFDSGSFDYTVNVSVNDSTNMKYTGTFQMDIDDQLLSSVYHAEYNEYQYDSVTYYKNAASYQGNYYDGKWTVSDNTDKVIDFIDFYGDYRKGDFDAGAFVRFTNSTKSFSASQLQKAFGDIIDDFKKSSNLNNVLHMTESTSGVNTVVTFEPDVAQALDIIKSHLAPAFASANAYKDFCTRIDDAKGNLATTKATVSYTVDGSGYLTAVELDYRIKTDRYVISAALENFGEAQIKIPDGFFTAAGIKE